MQHFYCEICDYGCSRKFLLDQHYLTRKHKDANILAKKDTKMHIFDDKMQICSCGKVFNHRSSLSRHKKICKNKNPGLTMESTMDEKHQIEICNDTILGLVKQNQEFQKLLIEQNRQIVEWMNKNANTVVQHNSMNIQNTIHNKFNLNVFLNEKCKDALNISEFINGLEITMADLERVGTSGFVEGISRIFVKGLQELDVYKRPIHCSDLKREIMHVKENNVWEKEDDSRPKIIHAIRRIADKNIKTIPEWKNAYPDCRYSDSKKSDQYLNIVRESVGACDKVKDEDNYDKIIRKVAKEVLIDKTVIVGNPV